MQQNTLIPLDRRKPFVNAIIELIEGRENYEEAIRLLIQAENQYGLRIIYDGDVNYLGPPPGLLLIEGLLPSIQELRNPDNQELLWAHHRQASPEMYEAADRKQLFPFMSETSFLIGGMDFANNHFIQFESGLLCTYTDRGWGQTLAEWAQETAWMQMYKSLWYDGEMTYCNFAFQLHKIVDQYDTWVKTVQKVMQLKCKQQLAQETA